MEDYMNKLTISWSEFKNLVDKEIERLGADKETVTIEYIDVDGYAKRPAVNVYGDGSISVRTS